MSADARQIIASADRHRQVATDADLARVKIRFSQKPVVRRGVLGFHKEQETDRELVFTPGETAAIYEALAIVASQHRADAERLEATVTVHDESAVSR